MAKGKHARSGRSGGKKGRGANSQTRRNLLVSESDDPFTRPESVACASEGVDEQGEEQCPPGSSNASSFLFEPLLLYPLPQMSQSRCQ